MASFNGMLWSVPVEYDEETWNPGFGQKNTVALDQALWDSTAAVFGTYGDENPVNILDQSHTAQAQDGDQYGWLDWYNRIHIQYSILNLGNLLSSQVVTVEVFSTYFVDRVLTTVIPLNDAGLTLTPPSAYPITFLPWDSQLFELSISSSGPPTIDALYTFDFDVIDLELRVIGVRTVVWWFQPDWRNPIIERLEWLTSVERSYSGKEQRMGLRPTGPRCEFEFSFWVTATPANIAQNLLYEWQSRVWALPIWPDGTRATGTASGSSVPVDTTTRDFHVGGMALISDEQGETYESFEIDSMTDTELVPVLPLTSSWPAGSSVFPIRTARLRNQQPTKRSNAAGFEATAIFRLMEPIERVAATETQYRGYPVLEHEGNWRDFPGFDWTRIQDELDNLTTAEPRVFDGANLSIPKQHLLWSADTRTELEELREFLYARKGRWKAIWVPTFASDLRLNDEITAVEVNIDVEYQAIVGFLAGNVHRRDIRIELNDGTVFYRRVTNFVQVDATTERMTMNSALGVLVNPEDVHKISWMMLARLDHDGIEIAWTSPGHAEAVMVMAGFNNDV